MSVAMSQQDMERHRHSKHISLADEISRYLRNHPGAAPPEQLIEIVRFMVTEEMKSASPLQDVHAESLVDPLVAKARKLVDLLDDAETNHGGLWSGLTMRARDELRQELHRWSK